MMYQSSWFQKALILAKTHFSFLIPKSEKTKNHLLSFWDETYEEAVNFTGLSASKESVLALAYLTFISILSILLLIDICIVLIYKVNGVPFDFITILIMIIATISVPFVIMQYIVSYPKTLVTYSKIHSLGDIPEVLCYLVMALKLSPNLEQSLIFTAKESSNSLVRNLRKLLWDMQIRVYHSVNEALTIFATRWGKYNESFKRSLYLIRSSIDEPDEAQRMMTLNKALDVGLDGIRDMMRAFADQLHQPIMIIYSIGIMIPLSIIAMLPAAGLIGLQITIFQVFFIYDILLPTILFMYMRQVLLHRPATFSPPKIPKNHPSIQQVNRKKISIISIIIGVLFSTPAILYFFYIQFPSINQFPLIFFIAKLNKTIPVTLFFLWGLVISFFVYSHFVYRNYYQIRQNIKSIEKEFSDALYILGKRLREGKSPEESLLYTATTMKGSSISRLFSDTVFALSAHHTTLYYALFHPKYGSMHQVYSNRIHTIMKLFVKGAEKSQKTASLSIIRLADHLKALQEVEKHIKESLATLTATLRSTASVFAPLIAGVTLAITQLISSIIEKMTINTPSNQLVPLEHTAIQGITQSFALENIESTWFILVIGIYIIQLVFLLTRFTNGIEDGDDMICYLYDLGNILPIAMFVLTISIFASSLFLNSLAITF